MESSAGDGSGALSGLFVMVQSPNRAGTFVRGAWQGADHLFDRAFGTAANPLRQLGALAFLALWLLALSGLWLYAVFDTSVVGAHTSIAELSRHPLAPGAILRSLHRYATDAFVLFTALHLLREASFAHWQHVRRHAWLTGCALLPIAAVSVIGGFWLNWDVRGQFSALATAEWLDALPLLAQPLARNFLTIDALSNRFFSLLVFVHLGAPLLLVFGGWFHLQRLGHPTVFPARSLAIGTLCSLLLLCLIVPLTSAPPADLRTVPAALSLDWWALAVHPLMYATSPAFTWFLLGGSFIAICTLPWWPAPVRPRAAVVDPVHCNGCRRCVADCPYDAITMVPHPHHGQGRELAQVDAARCVACGLCVGSCPSATPLRRAAPAASGIDLPLHGVPVLRAALMARLAPAAGARPILVFACAESAQPPTAPDLYVIPLVCAGQLAPSFIEYGLRLGAAAVAVVSCGDGACAYRLGARWAKARLAGTREPRLRVHVRGSRVCLIESARGDETGLARALDNLRRSALDSAHRPAPPSTHAR